MFIFLRSDIVMCSDLQIRSPEHTWIFIFSSDQNKSFWSIGCIENILSMCVCRKTCSIVTTARTVCSIIRALDV